jgi:DNA sulfur modification protein DndC
MPGNAGLVRHARLAVNLSFVKSGELATIALEVEMRWAIDDILPAIQRQYSEDARPWIVGYSGGKDSTTLVQFVFHALLKLPASERTKAVHIVSSDTLVEIPNVARMVTDNLAKMQDAAKKLDLPITTALVKPQVDDTFFVNIVGRGYPSPNRWFRWCTERMKIDPTSRYILDVVNKQGEVIVLLGARKEESGTRAQVLSSYEIRGTGLRRHSTLPRCYVFAPLQDLTTQEVWFYLLGCKSPWGADNRSLFALYKRAEGGECPLVIDESTPSCGNSRFGCWTCTVVDRDKAMEGFIDSGDEHLQPMLEFRNWLREIRDNPRMREQQRKNGQDGLGPFTFKVRKEILKRLLLLEKQTGQRLISIDELLLIQRIWQEGDRFSADTEFSVAAILRETKGESAMASYLDLLEGGVDPVLEKVCQQYGLTPELLQRLRAAEERVAHLQRREGIFHDIDDILESAPAASAK